MPAAGTTDPLTAEMDYLWAGDAAGVVTPEEYTHRMVQLLKQMFADSMIAQWKATR